MNAPASGKPDGMTDLSNRTLRKALRPYIARANGKAVTLFLVFYAKLVVFTVLALYIDNIWLQVLFSIAAGAGISSLFVIGHDAAHSSYTSSTRLDGLLGRLAMLPALHNFTLWRIVHNRMHHSDTCIQGINSWSPLSKSEYDAAGSLRRFLERLYRTPLGLGPYYLIQRWLKEKFIPPAHLRGTKNNDQWLDLGLVLAFLAALAVAFEFAASALDHLSYAEAWLFGFVLPFTTWNYLIGFTVYQQHTHPLVPWFRNVEDAERTGVKQHELSVQVLFPKWFSSISNNIMEHPAHHVNTKVPLYHLPQAQAYLNTLVGSSAVIQRFSRKAFLQVMSHCKLYDYDNQIWLGFDGQPSRVWPAEHTHEKFVENVR
ncbi:MAG: omega-6 fatty acid desaturase (delta-12 desaturase) [Gammaproteobacteria bacterium]|jgi:omega-6 fatty acid desaturase (delta-12 desaturase)